MSRAGSQQRTLLELLGALRPHWRRDRALPARIQMLLARRRAFGSRDRRLYRELIYTTLRHLPWVESLLDADPEFGSQVVAWLAGDAAVTARFRDELLPGWPPCPTSVAGRAATLRGPLPGHPGGAGTPDPAALLPEWFRAECPEAFTPPQLDALLARAPLWIRVQAGEAAGLADELAAAGIRSTPSPVLPAAIRILDPVDLTKLAAFGEGRIEIQDAGSQMVLGSADLPRGRWLDACAGAGGKTLQLAQLLGDAGHVDAHDIRPEALAELGVRAARARLRNVTTLRSAPTGSYDGVLVDAPCTGSGTWRRAPQLKWTTTPAHVAAAAEQQRVLLDEFSARVRPGGRLVYATCSLCRQENENVAAAFLAGHSDFAVVPPARNFGARRGPAGLTFLPAQHDSDGFFVAGFQRI